MVRVVRRRRGRRGRASSSSRADGSRVFPSERRRTESARVASSKFVVSEPSSSLAVKAQRKLPLWSQAGRAESNCSAFPSAHSIAHSRSCGIVAPGASVTLGISSRSSPFTANRCRCVTIAPPSDPGPIPTAFCMASGAIDSITPSLLPRRTPALPISSAASTAPCGSPPAPARAHVPAPETASRAQVGAV